jgi:hypothetical protein
LRHFKIVQVGHFGRVNFDTLVYLLASKDGVPRDVAWASESTPLMTADRSQTPPG